MIDKKTIHKDVEDGMNYLEQMESIELDHYFDIRVEAGIRQIETESRVNRVPSFRKAPRLAFIILLCIVNLLSVFYFSGIFSRRPEPALPAADVYVEAMSTAYSMEQNTHDLVFIKTMKDSPSGG
ncbi:MAG: hypothetical protein GY950_30720 [bacterium]|nr:hypothetical protein [bacterium]